MFTWYGICNPCGDAANPIWANRGKKESQGMQRCPQCKKILFKKRDGRLVCPNECDKNTRRIAFNTVLDPIKDRRAGDTWNPWNNVKF